MPGRISKPQSPDWIRIGRRSLPLALLLLLIEFHDELAYGALGAALPAVRLDLDLSYAEIGLLVGIPGLLSSVVEPAILLLGHTNYRHRLIVGGGVGVALAFGLISLAPSFPVLLLALVLAYPAGGGFVSLAQASMMDANPGRESQGMSRWVFAGALGSLVGPLVLGGALEAGLGWRPPVAAFGFLAAALALGAARSRLPRHPAADPAAATIRGLWAVLRDAARNRQLLRWILLLNLSDLGLDIFTFYVPLYLVDVAGATIAQAALAVALLHASDIAASAALIPLLHRQSPRRVLRWSAAAAVPMFLAWLLVPGLAAKLALLPVLGAARAAWYPVLQGEAYASHPGHSAAVTALGSVAGPLNAGLGWLVGWAAQLAGIAPAMLIILAAPLGLAVLVPAQPKEVQ